MPPEHPPSTIILMRHGETDWNRRRRIMGALDIPLNDAGRTQCEAAANVLAGFGVDRVITSPYTRAFDSAAIVGERLGLEPAPDDRLREVEFGRWAGRSYEEIMADPDYAQYAADPAGARTPGGESIADVQARGEAAIGEHAAAGGVTVLVSHGDIIRSLVAGFLGLDLAFYRRVRVDNAGLCGIGKTGGRVEVKFVNMLADPARAFDPLHWGGSA